jgi:3-phenylpropionate/trans-cinnamate dioxygenase ferredoxin reductase subunit
LVVIGGGYIGLEVASAARGQGCKVTVVEALDQLLKRSALAPVAAWLQRRHESEGVQFYMGRKVASLHGREWVEGVELDSGEVIPADTVMVGVGVRPDLRWLEGSGITVGRGVRVDQTCRTNDERIYAAGDVAEFQHPLLEGLQVLESVQNAVSQGKLVAANLLGRREEYAEVPWFWSEQYDCKLQMAGIPRAGDRLVHRNNPDTGGFSVFTLSDGQLNAVQSLNSPRDYMLGRQLISHGVAPNDNALSDPHCNLKDLL